MKLDELVSKTKEKMALENYATDTIDAYIGAIKRFFGYLSLHRDVWEMDHTQRMEKFLTWRVVEHDVSPSTQNVDFNALLYLGRSILGVEIGKVDALRAQPRQRVPHIITPAQVAQFLDGLPGEYALISRLLYGAGLRINECLNLRLKDVDLNNRKLIVHSGKGDKDGIVPIPFSLVDELHAQVVRAVKLWERDRHHNINGVYVPHALARKYQNAPVSRDWFWFFPNRSLGNDKEGVERRFHVYEFSVQKAYVITRRKLGLPEFVTPHAMRHFFATHFLQHMLGQGIPESMARQKLMEYLRHASLQTMDWYVHLAMPESSVVKSPMDLLVKNKLMLSNAVG